MKNCPCCKDTLLRYICHSEIIWFCPTCRQEMPNPEVLIKTTNNNNYLKNNKNLEKYFLESKINSLKYFVAKNNFRLEIVNFILSYQNLLISKSIVCQFNQPQCLIYSEQEINNYQQKATYFYSTQLFLSCIAYAFLIGDISVLDHSRLNNLKQTHINIGIPFTNFCREVELLKIKIIAWVEQTASSRLEHISQNYCSCVINELETYFDAAMIVINI